jgi:putative flippase GtrA
MIVGQLLRFSVVGTIGFAVDIAVLYTMRHLGLDLYSARVVSFLVAATTTWLGNRIFTFSRGNRPASGLSGEYASYLSAMMLGGLVNYGIYALLITWVHFLRDHPWLAVVAGTGAGLLINFTLARRILHRAAD